MRRLIMLISVGWLPPYLCPSRRLSSHYARGSLQPLNDDEGCALTGAAPLSAARDSLHIQDTAGSCTCCAIAHM